MSDGPSRGLTPTDPPDDPRGEAPDPGPPDPGAPDPGAPDPGAREERFYGRLLLAMVIALVGAGFVLGIIANILTALGRG